MMFNDTWVVNPACTQYDLYQRFGRIIGMAIRCNIPLELYI